MVFLLKIIYVRYYLVVLVAVIRTIESTFVQILILYSFQGQF